ncbi:MAG: SIR2 family protein [Pseudonocardiaceae bacterium]
MSDEARSVAQHYLDGLAEDQRAELEKVNGAGRTLLQEILDEGQGLAFLGAGVSAPLYPLWAEVITKLIDGADQLTEEEAHTCRALATSNPDAVVDIVRDRMGDGDYQEALRTLFAPRKDSATQRTWTRAHELVARCNFAGVITTNYDPGIANARMAVRTQASATGFASWHDKEQMVRWRQGKVFGDDELPVLFAHGRHNQSGSIVLATTEYRRAYRDGLSAVLGQLLDTRPAVWIGFSFTDRRIEAILREIGDRSSTSIITRPATRHVAIMPWDPAAGLDPGTIRSIMEIQFGCRVVHYPAPEEDHSALGMLLAELTDPRYPAAAVAPPQAMPPRASRSAPAQQWVHGRNRVTHFTGRVEELARLTRWARDPEVRLVSVTAWGGAGKTALVTEWLTGRNGAQQRPAIRGVFAWGFYQRNSVLEWATELLCWAAQTFHFAPRPGPLASQVLAVLREVPLIIVLDGLEVIQEGPAGGQFGRLLDGTLRAVLTGACQPEHAGLVMLTSRFPFADLEQFDGGAARMMDVPPFTQAEGAAVLAAAGGDWLSEAERRELVRAVDRHALAVGVLAGALADRPPLEDLRVLLATLLKTDHTDTRVGKALRFYADRSTEADRTLVAIVGLFQRPVPVATVLALGSHDTTGVQLAGWTPAHVETAVRQRLSGLLSWHPDATLSAHPLVRDAFRPLILTGNSAHLAVDTVLSDLPAGSVTSRDDALRVVEMIELLVDADEWQAADRLRADRLGGYILQTLPAAQLGQRCAAAFVGTPSRRSACRNKLHSQFGHYLNQVGLMGMNAGNLTVAAIYLTMATEECQSRGNTTALSTSRLNISALAIRLGDTEAGVQAGIQVYETAAVTGDREKISESHAYLGWANDLAGATRSADEHFMAADLIERTDDPDSNHLYSLRGTTWASQLSRTGRVPIARRLTERNREICYSNGWRADSARCDRELGCCDLIDGDIDSAGRRLLAAADVLQDGEFLVEWAATLPDLAEHRRRTTQLDEAERICTEAITAAGPRGLVPTHARGLATRALVRGDQFGRTGDRDHLERARDDAEHALRLATRTRRLPWQELEAYEAHAHLDHLEGHDHGWRARAEDLRAELIPSDLDPDPLATVEAQVREARNKNG